MRKWDKVSVLIGSVLLARTLLATSVPEWLPEDYRFSVSSNEAAEVEQTLALMRDALHLKLRAMMKADDLGPTLQWIVHVSQPGKSDEVGYFETFKPDYRLSFDRTTLTNRASRLSILPPRVKLSLVYDDGTRSAISRPVPGVDYPGVMLEDEGTTEHDVRLVLRAPKLGRRFRIHASVSGFTGRELEFRWMAMQGCPDLQNGPRTVLQDGSILKDIYVRQDGVQSGGAVLIAVFAREKGRMWWPPSYVHIDADPLCKHEYFKNEIFAIDYGEYRDTYNLDEKGRILGFDRIEKATLVKTHFSNEGEIVLETYPNEVPKVTRKVRYFIENGILRYAALDEDIRHIMEPMTYRSVKW